MIKARWHYTLLALVSLLLCNAAHAESYICFNSTGRMISADRSPPECKGRDIQVFNRQRLFIKTIPAPLTSEQCRVGNATHEMRRECVEMLERLKKEALKRAEEAGERVREEQERVRREQQERARNQRPIPLYRDPKELIEEIDIAHRRTLADLQALVDRAEQSIPQYLQEHQRLVDEVMSNGNHELTSELKDALEAKRALVQRNRPGIDLVAESDASVHCPSFWGDGRWRARQAI